MQHILAIPAHLPIQHIGEFFNGILHPFLTPAHILTIVAAGLLAGQYPERTLALCRIFMGAVALGLLASAFGFRIDTQLPLLMGVMSTGLIVAVYPRRIPPWEIFMPAIALGLLVGIDSPFDGLTIKQLFWALLGCFIGVSFSAFYVALLAKKARHPWHHIAIRVGGSWIVAICLMVTALSLVSSR